MNAVLTLVEPVHPQGHKPLESLEAEVAKARTSLGLSSDDDLPCVPLSGTSSYSERC